MLHSNQLSCFPEKNNEMGFLYIDCQSIKKEPICSVINSVFKVFSNVCKFFSVWEIGVSSANKMKFKMFEDGAKSLI